MSVTPFAYTTHPVDPRLQQWIRGAWEFAAGPEAPPEHHVPPDGTASMVLVGGDPTASQLHCFGPRVTPMVVATNPGTVFRGLRIAGEAAPLLLGVQPDDLIPGPVEVTRFGPVAVRDLAGALRHDSAAAIAAAVDSLLLPLISGLPNLDRVAVVSLALIRESAGRLPLGAVAGQAGVSGRTLLRRIKSATGLTPKQHVRIARFYATAVGMLDPAHRLSRLAATGGYSDQSHFHHEVIALTGLTPGELATRVRQTTHCLDR